MSRIDAWAFEGCTSLTQVTIPNSVRGIGDDAFKDCSGLTSIIIPESVTSIGGMAFEYCTGLTSVTIPESVTSIGCWAFHGCSGLTFVTIPDSVTSIGYAAFYVCTSLNDLSISVPTKTLARRANKAYLAPSEIISHKGLVLGYLKELEAYKVMGGSLQNMFLIAKHKRAKSVISADNFRYVGLTKEHVHTFLLCMERLRIDYYDEAPKNHPIPAEVDMVPPIEASDLLCNIFDFRVYENQCYAVDVGQKFLAQGVKEKTMHTIQL
ncbi:leucine-rich repeat domain-containing protein [Candidatus Comchoanobacter bicostacola]|uniref:Leucine-rich repeat domain-containing protein n=1 Tax=Candidatus Comchoanobacter bicostacola TaxID=2919598 RepID=A0ABY5DH79_9GAMM|nr:leucine-rich repeat domain-containing protein [Candidatus Comchoanobacter bicostacola]UTC24120.1 leucine-rich repeat domain-containing protein [Candidatus Comchoanobacter bicostacola]